jgi:hypothetical protein
MVKAYTLSDKIVQQGYNDFESFVGLVFKRLEGGNCQLSSLEELQNSTATPISVGQVAAAVCDDSEIYDTYSVTAGMINLPASSDILSRVTGSWIGSYDQYIVVRRLDSFPIIDPSAPAAPVGICYKIVVDAYTAPTAP